MSRLAVLDPSGGVLVVDPEPGGRVVELTPGTRRIPRLQPTWSPSGSHVAWGEVGGGESVGGALVVCRADGGNPVTLTEGFGPFCLSWSADGEALAALSGGPLGLELEVVDVLRRETRVVARGAPLFFAWSRAEPSLALHVGDQVLDVVDPAGARRPVGGAPGAFGVPQWVGDGSRVVVVTADGEGQRLVVVDTALGEGRPLARVGGLARFAVGPGGDRVAWFGSERGGGLRGTLPVGRAGQVVVQELGGRVVDALEVAPLAMQWSPDGQCLLLLTSERERAATWLRWLVWSGGEPTPFDRFRAGTTFARQYLPFFDQYGLALSLWAPDSSAFTYPTRAADERDVVVVQPQVAGAAPLHVGEGVLASWAPA